MTENTPPTPSPEDPQKLPGSGEPASQKPQSPAYRPDMLLPKQPTTMPSQDPDKKAPSKTTKSARPKKLDGDLSLTDLIHKTSEELDVDPFRILLYFAGNKWAELGLADANVISPGLRFRAAAEASKYMYPTLRSVELTGAGGGPVELKNSLIDEFMGELEEAARQRLN